MTEKEKDPIDWTRNKEEPLSEGEPRSVEMQCVKPFMVEGNMVTEGQRVRGVPEFMARDLVERGRAKILTTEQ